MIKIISTYYRPILIHVIRLLPLLCATAILFGAVETLYSINIENSTKYAHEDGTSYIVYNTPMADYLAKYFASTYDKIFLLFLLSKVFKFCAYHRVFIWFMLVNRVMDEICKRVVWSVSASVIPYIVAVVWILCLFLALYLHQKYGDRELA